MTYIWLIRDVFRQAWASGLTAVLIVLTTVTMLVAASAGYSDGRLTTLFGTVTLQEAATRDEAISILRSIVVGVAADTVGVLLALVWTSGFLPEFVDPAFAGVLLAKPPGRYTLLLGKSLGVLIYFAVYAVVVIAMTWIGLGISMGRWPAVYWLGVPLLIAQFAVFFGFAALIAVATRSATATSVASVLFWLACFGMNYGRHVLAMHAVPGTKAVVGNAAELGYWLFPKPVDFGLILANALGDNRTSLPLLNPVTLAELEYLSPITSLVASLAFGLTFLAMAAFEFAHDDY